METAYDVFISYRRRTGEDFALHLKDGLEEEGIHAFLDIADIPRKFEGKSEWWKFRDDSLSNSRIFLLIITDGIETSPEIAKEISRAFTEKKECVFFRHKGLKPEIVITLGETKLNLKEFNQTEFDTKNDLLRSALRILREPQKAAKLEDKIAPLDILGELRKKAVTTEEILGRLEDFEVDYLRGNWFLREGNYEKALSLYERALANKPNFVLALIKKGITLDSLNRHDEALVCFDRSNEIEPTSLAWALKGTVLISLEKYNQAIACYDKAIEIEQSSFAYYNKGVALDSLGEYTTAITCYDRAIELNPNDASFWHNKAFALFQLQEYHEAISCSNKAIEIEPTGLRWALRGVILAHLDKPLEARNCFEEALKIDQDDSTILRYYSELLVSLGETAKGLELAHKALQRLEDSSDRIFTYFLCVVAYYLSGEDEKAKVETERLLINLKQESRVKLKNQDFSLLVPIIRKRLDENIRNQLFLLIRLILKGLRLN